MFMPMSFLCPVKACWQKHKPKHKYKKNVYVYAYVMVALTSAQPSGSDQYQYLGNCTPTPPLTHYNFTPL